MGPISPIASASAIAASGMIAAIARIGGVASNVANMDDESAVGAGGYQPALIGTQTTAAGGVTAVATSLKPASALAFDPTSSLASTQGLVSLPDVDPVSQMASQLSAGSAFLASLKAYETADQTQKTLLDMTA